MSSRPLVEIATTPRPLAEPAPARFISIRGAAEHNLQQIDLDIPRDKLVVFTGVSGSGKSSLAFDTIYAEGQRRYVESLSAYARQFLGLMEKPKVDYIGGLSPAISIEQKTTSKNPRSTVGTITEIYDYLRVLWARVGKQHCHLCGRPASAQTIEQIVDSVLGLGEGTRLLVLAPLVRERKGEYKDVFEQLRREGYVRARVNGEVFDLENEPKLDKRLKHSIEVVVDRLVLRDDIRSRLFDSVERALAKGEGVLIIADVTHEHDYFYSRHNACIHCGVSFEELSPNSFSFNSPLGRCPECDGLGRRMEIDPAQVVPNPALSVKDGALHPWKTLFERADNSHWARRQWAALERFAQQHDIDLDTPWKKLSKVQQNLLLYGNKRARPGVAERARGGSYPGLICEMEWWWRNTASEGYRNYVLENYIHNVPCPACGGSRLRPESMAVKVGGRSLHEVCALPVEQEVAFFAQLELEEREQRIAAALLKEIRARLGFLNNVGLYYLALDRSAPTLSGGEAQRIRLASQIGSGLTGVLYVLDEPSIGLHQRDNAKLLASLERLRDLGNTVLVVEHDENTMRRADWLVDFGPGAGKHGGRIVAQGKPHDVTNNPYSLTGMYLSGKCGIPVPPRRRPPQGRVVVRGARENNLRNIDVAFPLACLVCVTGVSGSGKSTLVNEILHKSLMRSLYRSHHAPGAHDRIDGLQHLDKVIEISQDPIGRTPRSNPATYVKVFDPIRQLFAELPEAKVRGYAPGRFSFNVPGGRCEACEGAGVKQIEMHFLPDVYVSCDVCKGRRFNEETLRVQFKGYDIARVLDLTVAEALELFANIPRIRRVLGTLRDVGLDYIALGQPATTLSGGEAQRVKLAKELCKVETGRTMYILDEPTTGLHFADVAKLLNVLQRLVDKGNSVVVIEHNLDVIKCADWIIDLGPEGGAHGGTLVAEGTPEEIAANPASHTGQFLREALGR